MQDTCRRRQRYKWIEVDTTCIRLHVSGVNAALNLNDDGFEAEVDVYFSCVKQHWCTGADDLESFTCPHSLVTNSCLCYPPLPPPTPAPRAQCARVERNAPSVMAVFYAGLLLVTARADPMGNCVTAG